MPRKIEPPGYHEVDAGDWISKIAEWYGLASWTDIWDHGNNAGLRAQRKSPDIIFPGDLVYVPARAEKKEPRPTDNKHRFLLKRDQMRLRIRVLNEVEEPRKSQPYKLVMHTEDGQEIIERGNTDGDGKLEHQVPIKLADCRLYIEYQVIEVRVGHLDPLEPVETVSGVQGRLHNLGYDPGPVDGIMGPRTKEGIRAFQRDHPPLKIDGICGPKTRAELKKLHAS